LPELPVDADRGVGIAAAIGVGESERRLQAPGEAVGRADVEAEAAQPVAAVAPAQMGKSTQ
jgi:hypothetical protein